MDVRILPATLDDLAFVGRRLRLADRIELGLGDEDGTHLLIESAEGARWCNAVHVDGEPAVIYGVTPFVGKPRWGCPWLLATDKASKLRRAFVTHSKAEVELMLAGFPFLHNLVHDRHEDAIRWLIWLGFYLDFANPVTRHGLTFIPFWKGDSRV